jgi:DNA-binding CsgD family transcriptional regulator
MASEQMKKDMARLRRRMDGSDSFMEGHQITKIRTRARAIPEWALNDEAVKTLLLRVFPKLHVRNSPSARAAGRWLRIIHLYYRAQISNTQISKEMNMTLNAVKMVLKGIRRIERGRKYDNRGPWKQARGRPKK